MFRKVFTFVLGLGAAVAVLCLGLLVFMFIVDKLF
jgi:hypothetical protein